MDDAGIDALRDAIKNMHGVESTWIESAPVVEKFNGKIVWAGEVQVFELSGHPKAKRCYAWSHATEGRRRRFIAVLGVSPVNGPVDAVRAAIASGT